MRRSLIIVLVVVGVVFASYFALSTGRLGRAVISLAALHAGQPATKFPANFSEATIPFELVNRHVMLRARVNNSRPLWFILDTGDRYAVIDSERAKELGLKLGMEIKIGGVGPQSTKGAFVEASQFSIPEIPDFSQAVTLAMPLGNLAPRLGHGVDGIIGAEFIRQFVVEVDYERQVIKLHNKDTFHYSGPGEAIPIHLNASGHPIAKAEVIAVGGDTLIGDYAIDIGSGGFLALSSPVVLEHHFPGPTVKTIRDIGSSGTGGQSQGLVGRVSVLKIGSHVIRDPITVFSTDRGGAFASTEVQGNIGGRIMSRFNIFLDYSHDRIILEPNSSFPRLDNRAFSGLVIHAEGQNYKTFRIADLLENSPASESGLKAGDVITEVDSKRSSELTLTQLLDLFEQNATYGLTIVRGAQTLKFTITPRKLV